MEIFLETLMINSTELVFDKTTLISFLGLAIIFFSLMIGIWIYMSFAYMAIAKKNKQKHIGLAWIPSIGPLIIALKAAKMPWWPLFLTIGFFIPFINIFFIITLTIFIIIWHWKMFKAINKPEWWAILMLVPVINLIFIGIAAWSKKKFS